MVVIDASFVVAYFVEETHSPAIRAIMNALTTQRLLAPVLLHWEVSNALAKKVARKQLDEPQALEAAIGIDALAIELRFPEADIAELMLVATQERLSTYDAAYLQLALDEHAALATNDQDLAEAALRHGLTIHSPFS